VTAVRSNPSGSVLYFHHEKKAAETELVHLLSLVVALWLGYLLVLAGIDHSFYPRPVFRLPFYLINGLDALVVLGLSL
jgi:hypothetical protein